MANLVLIKNVCIVVFLTKNIKDKKNIIKIYGNGLNVANVYELVSKMI